MIVFVLHNDIVYNPLLSNNEPRVVKISVHPSFRQLLSETLSPGPREDGSIKAGDATVGPWRFMAWAKVEIGSRHIRLEFPGFSQLSELY